MAEGNGSRKRNELLIVGASTRAAAYSAIRAGCSPVCYDYYADHDTQAVAEVHQIASPQDLVELICQHPPAEVMYVGGIENAPEVLTCLSEKHHLIGNPLETVQKIRPVSELKQGLRLARINIPESRTASDPPAADGTWCLKPVHSAGGFGVVIWDENAQDHPTLGREHLFQQFVKGVPYSALFVASGNPGDVRFVGITQQILGDPNCNADAFQWCGNIGPCILDVGIEHRIRRVGNILKSMFGMKGIFGIDFVLDESGEPWLIEINPRYPGSTELLEHITGYPLLVDHCAAFKFDGELAPAWNQALEVDFVAKAIFYSPRDFEVTSLLANPASPEIFPTITDIPTIGTKFQAGDPVCSVFATGSSLVECRAALQQQLQQVAAWVG